ncbi:thioredoxin family protein [Candidatus Woesearchaeota archaeon]|nr:thioredoxin family protein [Candidatus Woesearchaeota archaeon]
MASSNLSKYIAAFSITTLIFIVGILIGNAISSAKMEAIDALQQDITVRTIGSEMQYLLLAEHPCQDIHSSELSQELFEIGSKLAHMEQTLGSQDENVINLKRYYSLLEIRHWLLLKKAQQECNATYSLILYFYSNRGDCDACKQQGYVLNTIHRKYPDVNIYSFDVNIPDTVLATIKQIYNITAPPTIVVNGKKMEGLVNKDEVEQELFGVEEGEKENDD